MSFNKRSTTVQLVVGALLGAVFFILPGCQGPAGPAGKDGLTLHDTLHLYDTVVKKDTVFHKDTTIINTHDTTTIKDTILKRDTTVKIDTLLMNPSCLGCHATGKWDSINAEYQMSYHFTRGVVNNSSKFCERCHTSEGFQEITADGLPMAAAAIPMATRISCKTCHQKNGLDFIDTAADILRTIDPVVLNYNNSFTSGNVWNTQTTTNFGEIDNLCGTCHQIRGSTAFTYMDTTTTVNGAANASKTTADKTFTQLAYFPVSKYAPTDTVQYRASTSFAVHDGNQTNQMKGVNAYEYPAVSYATGAGKDTASWHHLNAQCTDCHMATQYSAADSTGGHTFRINRKDAKCSSCHNLATQMSTDSIVIAGKLVTLGDMLVARKIMTKKANTTAGQLPFTYTALPSHDFYGTLYDSTNTGKVYAATAGNNSVAPTTGLLTYDNMITWTMDTAHVSEVVAGATASVPNYSNRIGRAWKGGELGAAYNFSFVYTGIYQHSFAIHNPAYAKAVLQASIDWLTANP